LGCSQAPVNDAEKAKCLELNLDNVRAKDSDDEYIRVTKRLQVRKRAEKIFD
jgi:hypothetical protein